MSGFRNEEAATCAIDVSRRPTGDANRVETLDITTVTALADHAFTAFAKRTMFEFQGIAISYGAMGGYVERLAARLSEWGLGQNDVVALYFPNSPYHAIGLFAALKAGCRVICLSPLDALRELAFKLRDSGARTLLTAEAEPFLAMTRQLIEDGLLDHWAAGSDDFWGNADGTSPSTAPVSLIEIITGPAPVRDTWPAIAIDDVALIQYTGGTTGTPKGAVLTHGNLTAGLAMFNRRFHAESFSRPGEERMLGVLPMFHIYALVGVLLRSAKCGDTILLRARFDVETTLDDIEHRRVSWFFGVPTMFIALAEHPGAGACDFSSLTCCVSGGAPFPVEVAQRIERLIGNVVYVGWGMTETCGAGTLTLPVAADRVGSIGQALPAADIQIVDLDDPARVLGPGETGEMRIRGPHVCAGYWNQPEESAAAFRDGYLLTGDVGHVDAEGHFYLVDRKKDLIISGGYNVYPRAIEDAIYEHQAVEEVLVFGIPDRYRGEAAKAAIKLRAGHEPFSIDALRDFLASRLGRHELPSALEFHAALPRTAVGKLSRKEPRSAVSPIPASAATRSAIATATAIPIRSRSISWGAILKRIMAHRRGSNGIWALQR